LEPLALAEETKQTLKKSFTERSLDDAAWALRQAANILRHEVLGESVSDPRCWPRCQHE
jgi:hypothetical protein